MNQGSVHTCCKLIQVSFKVNDDFYMTELVWSCIVKTIQLFHEVKHAEKHEDLIKALSQL